LARSLNNLAGLLDAQGAAIAARLRCDRAVMMVEQALGRDHPTTRSYRAHRGLLVQRLTVTGVG